MDRIINAKLKLLEKGTGNPLTSENIIVKLYDKDLLEDDLLAESKLDNEGNALFTFSEAKYKSKDSPLETKGDFYFIVFEEGKEIYKSSVSEDIDFMKTGTLDTQKGVPTRFRSIFNLKLQERI